MRNNLHRLIRLDGFLEGTEFLSAFCAGCSAVARTGECPTDYDVEDAHCARHRAWDEIIDTLNGARYDIVTTMEDAGCWA